MSAISDNAPRPPLMAYRDELCLAIITWIETHLTPPPTPTRVQQTPAHRVALLHDQNATAAWCSYAPSQLNPAIPQLPDYVRLIRRAKQRER